MATHFRQALRRLEQHIQHDLNSILVRFSPDQEAAKPLSDPEYIEKLTVQLLERAKNLEVFVPAHKFLLLTGSLFQKHPPLHRGLQRIRRLIGPASHSLRFRLNNVGRSLYLLSQEFSLEEKQHLSTIATRILMFVQRQSHQEPPQHTLTLQDRSGAEKGINVRSYQVLPSIWTPAPIGDNSIEKAALWTKLENVCVHQNGIVHDTSNSYLFDQGLHPKSHSWIDGFTLDASGRAEIFGPCFPSTRRRIERGVALLSRYPYNWFHWWFEVVALANEAAREFGDSIPLLLNSRPRGNYLGALTIASGNPRIPIGNAPVLVGELFMSPPPLQTRDCFSPLHSESVAYFDGELLGRVRMSILKKIRKSSPSDTEWRGTKVYLIRNSTHRNLVNQSTIQRKFEELNFRIVEVDALSTKEQISLFSSASIVASVGGAAMAGYLFANHSTQLLQIVASQNVRFPAPALLASVGRAKLTTLEGKSPRYSRNSGVTSWQHSNFRISPHTIDVAYELLSAGE